jgi:hypothetical protein
MNAKWLLLLPIILITPYTFAQRSVIISAAKKYSVETVGQYENSDHPEPHDSFKHKKLLFFGHEKGGAICVNGLEKLEIALSSERTLTAVSQLHFYGPLQTEGRVFMVAEQEKDDESAIHFFETTFDLTWKEFPLHVGYTMGLDQVAQHPNTTYSGLATTIYWSDIMAIHHTFHILRTGVSFLNLNEHLVNREGYDSTVALRKKIEYSVFYQMQPIHLNKETSLYSEGYLRLRENESFGEIELGIRHEKVLDNLFGLGVRSSWTDMHFHSVSGVIRFNISNPNPKHR